MKPCEWNVYHNINAIRGPVWVGKVMATYQTEAIKKANERWPEMFNELIVRPIDKDNYASIT